MKNRYYRRIFREVDGLMWAEAERIPQPDDAAPLETKARRIDALAGDAQKIITAYIDNRAAMMKELIADRRFSRFPLPKRRIPIWKKISGLLELL